MKIPALQDYPEFSAAWDRLQAVRGELQAAERELSRLRAEASDEDSPRARREAAAVALLEGREAEPAPAPSHRGVRALEDRVPTLREAVRLQERRVADLRVEASRAAFEAVSEDYHAAVEGVAVAAVTLSARVEAYFQLREGLEAAGVELGSVPGAEAVNLAPWRDTGDSFLSLKLDEIERDFGTQVKRPVLDARRRAEAAVREEENRIRQRTGNALQAGPGGIREWIRGKVRILATPPDPKAARAGWTGGGA